MKQILVAVSLQLMTFAALAQNVGVNTQTPIRTLSVNGSVMVDQGNTNQGTLDSALVFGTTGVGIFSNKVPGTTNFNGLDIWTANNRRVTVSSGGFVGINLGTTAPTSVLDVNGSIRARSSLTVNNNITVNNNANIEGNSIVDGNITIGGTASVGGRGIVRSNSSTNLRMGFTSGGYSITLPEGVSFDVTFNITPFTGSNTNVRVSICQFVPNAGSNDTWGRITMTAHSVDAPNNQCKVRFYNGSTATATMNGTLHLMSVATD